MSAYDVIIYEILDGVGYITLNRPRALNAYNIRMRDELYEVLGAVADDSAVKVVILKAAGDRAFCAGADLTEFLTAPPPVFARKARFDRDIWRRFLGVRKPFIAALHGYVLGSGIEMSLCCDIRLASDDAQFGLPEVSLGIIPAAGGSQTLPRTVGPANALDLLLSGRRISAAEARRIHLINRIVPRSDLLPEAQRLADIIKTIDPDAVSSAKHAINAGLDLSLEQGLLLERRLAALINR